MPTLCLKAPSDGATRPARRDVRDAVWVGDDAFGKAAALRIAAKLRFATHWLAWAKCGDFEVLQHQRPAEGFGLRGLHPAVHAGACAGDMRTSFLLTNSWMPMAPSSRP